VLETISMTKSVFSQAYDWFRENLVNARKARGLTQEEIARRLGRPQSYVSKYERGERRLDVVEFLEVAEALEIAPGELLHKLERQTNPKRKARRGQTKRKHP
jgi:transcriptional regulator with XRE-family HTH domain